MAERTEAIKELAAAAMAYGVSLAINDPSRLAVDLQRAGFYSTLADALAAHVDSLLELRPSLADNITGGEPS